ncbi:hypothetical protein FB45DRAFT_942540 [Roridomyces roridus]|uniref:Lipoprotein n=1 Tax=Roridomyces roridus TaxID=1738132 RepID=A0AAD7B593_9AGAR|nr:hypothetical protein FB45DRAFT_942540 [Roridomyces roridus]
MKVSRWAFVSWVPAISACAPTNADNCTPTMSAAPACYAAGATGVTDTSMDVDVSNATDASGHAAANVIRVATREYQESTVVTVAGYVTVNFADARELLLFSSGKQLVAR